MFPYWLLFGLFTVGAMVSPSRRDASAAISAPLIGLCTVFMALMIGLRYHVGADWGTYEYLFRIAGYADPSRVLKFGDPGYQLLNWSIRQLEGQIWQVNLICALIFCWGLLRLVMTQPQPWLAMVVAIPYLVVVVAMGYTRQAVAIGLLMAGLASILRGGSILRTAGYIALAALFHKTAIVALPLVIFSSERNRLFNVIAGVVLVYVFYNLFLERAVGSLVRNYIDTRYSSQGAVIRLALNFVPAALFLLWRNRFPFDARARKLWTSFAVAAVIFPMALLLSPSSAAVDRLALYVLPLQIVVLGSVPSAFRSPGLGTGLVVLYSALILFVWLNFATHAQYWLPYSVYPIS